MTIINNTSEIEKIRGVSIVEFVIVIPVFLLLVFACIDFARYTAAKGLLTTGAHRAVSLATVIPGLDLEPSEGVASIAIIEGAKQQITDTAKQIPTTTLFTFGSSTSRIALDGDPELVLPIPKPDETMLDALQREPIRVSMRGTYDPFLPLLPDLVIQSSSSGYREPRTMVSMPIPIDCYGNRIGSATYKRECDCWGPDYALNGSGICECALNDETCPGDQIVRTNGQCSCRCPENKIFDETTGTCGCTGEFMNPGETSSGRCECIDGFQCSGLKVEDRTNCLCACAENAKGNCLASGGVFDAGSCACNSCPSNKEPDPEGRICVCKVSPNCVAPLVESNDCGCKPKGE